MNGSAPKTNEDLNILHSQVMYFLLCYSQITNFFGVKWEKRLVRTLQFTFVVLCLTLLYFAIWLCNLLSNLKGVLYCSEKFGVLQSDTAFFYSSVKIYSLTNEDLNFVHCKVMYWFFCFVFKF
jgi:hypothetical protein